MEVLYVEKSKLYVGQLVIRTAAGRHLRTCTRATAKVWARRHNYQLRWKR